MSAETVSGKLRGCTLLGEATWGVRGRIVWVAEWLLRPVMAPLNLSLRALRMPDAQHPAGCMTEPFTSHRRQSKHGASENLSSWPETAGDANQDILDFLRSWPV
jgi:hypothetical protein